MRQTTERTARHTAHVARFLVFAGVMFFATRTPAEAQRAVFVVRHAEKVDSSKDAELSDAGRARAESLARMLKDAGITAIYSSDFKRTIHTAEPLAAMLKIQTTVLSHEPDAIVQKVRSHKPTDTVLVVGHSDTVPRILKGLGCSEAIEIGDTEYDNLFVVVTAKPSEPLLIRLRY